MSKLYAKLYEQTETGQSSKDSDIQAALSDPNLFTKWMGCKAAGISKDIKWFEKLSSLAIVDSASKNPDLNSIAIWAIAQIGGGSAKDFWLKNINSKDWNSRRAAADLIGETLDEDGLVSLSELLLDNNDEVRNWAALSLSKFGMKAEPMLFSYMKDTSDPELFLVIADALLKVRGLESDDTVMQLLSNWDETLRIKLNASYKALKLKYT